MGRQWCSGSQLRNIGQDLGSRCPCLWVLVQPLGTYFLSVPLSLTVLYLYRIKRCWYPPSSRFIRKVELFYFWRTCRLLEVQLCFFQEENMPLIQALGHAFLRSCLLFAWIAVSCWHSWAYNRWLILLLHQLQVQRRRFWSCLSYFRKVHHPDPMESAEKVHRWCLSLIYSNAIVEPISYLPYSHIPLSHFDRFGSAV